MSNPENFPDKDMGISQEQKKKDLARKDFEQEFDKTKSQLKNKMTEQDFEQFKKEWVDERMEEAEDLEESNSKREEAIAEIEEKKIDSVTGLEKRDDMYKTISDKIASILSIQDVKELSNQELFDRLKQKEEALWEQNIFVMLADVSYLGLVNKLGHQEGDRLLKDAGDATKQADIRAFRHGGDEISGFLESEESEVDESEESEVDKKVEQLKSIFANSEIKDRLIDDFKVKPNLDVGVAKFGEAFQVLKDLANSEEGKEYFKKESALKELQDIWVEIADTRSFIDKAVNRVELLAEKYNTDKQNYSQISDFLNKGMGELAEENIESFVGKTRDEIKEDLLNKQRSRSNELEGYERVKEKAIFNLLD